MVVPTTAAHGMSPPWQYAALTDRGRRRKRNEDACIALPAARIYAVADGMGGHAAGDVASKLAVNAVADAFPRAAGARTAAATLTRRLLQTFELANQAILDHAASYPECAGMGTTLTVLSPLPTTPQCVIAHIGDSRAYRMRAGELTQLTHDHTWVQQQVDAGMLTAVQARNHPLSSVLNRVLGTPSVGPADTFVIDALPGDRFLLCSDGLTTMLDDDDLSTLMRLDLPLDRLGTELITAANGRGGFDNITVLLLAPAAA